MSANNSKPTPLQGLVFPIIPPGSLDQLANEIKDKPRSIMSAGPSRETKIGSSNYVRHPFDFANFRVTQHGSVSSSDTSFLDLHTTPHLENRSQIGEAWVYEGAIGPDGSLTTVINQEEQGGLYCFYHVGKDCAVPDLQLQRAEAECGLWARLPTEIRLRIYRSLMEQEINHKTWEARVPERAWSSPALTGKPSDDDDRKPIPSIIHKVIRKVTGFKGEFKHAINYTWGRRSTGIGLPTSLCLNLCLTCRFMKADVTEYIYKNLGFCFRSAENLSRFISAIQPSTVLLNKWPRELHTVVLDLRLLKKNYANYENVSITGPAEPKSTTLVSTNHAGILPSFPSPSASDKDWDKFLFRLTHCLNWVNCAQPPDILKTPKMLSHQDRAKSRGDTLENEPIVPNITSIEVANWMAQRLRQAQAQAHHSILSAAAKAQNLRLNPGFDPSLFSFTVQAEILANAAYINAYQVQEGLTTIPPQFTGSTPGATAMPTVAEAEDAHAKRINAALARHLHSWTAPTLQLLQSYKIGTLVIRHDGRKFPDGAMDPSLVESLLGFRRSQQEGFEGVWIGKNVGGWGEDIKYEKKSSGLFAGVEAERRGFKRKWEA